jgi:hypothetical protein
VHPSGVECITITEHMGFNLGNALKYIWRADLKGDALEDLRKAAWYVQREIERRLRAVGGEYAAPDNALACGNTAPHQSHAHTGPEGSRVCPGVKAPLRNPYESDVRG